MIQWAPNVLQILITFCGDVSYLKWCRRFFRFHQKRVQIAVSLYLFNWFILYCSDRTLSNTVEMSMVIVILNACNAGSLKLQFFATRDLAKIAICVALTIMMRPTAILLIFPITIQFFYNLICNNELNEACRLLIQFALFSSLTYFMAFIVDSIFYRHPTFSILNFFRFNVIEGRNKDFGSHHVFWYFLEGFPCLLNVVLPVVASIFLFNHKKIKDFQGLFIASAAAFYILIHTAMTHKEHRFLLPVLPLLFPLIASIIDQGITSSQIKDKILQIYIVANVSTAIYFGLIHQRGPNGVSAVIRNELSKLPRLSRPYYITQLMPCYSLPQYSAFHQYNVEIRMLRCTERFYRTNQHGSEHFQEESSRFHSDMHRWLKENWRNYEFNRTDIIVLYERVYYETKYFWDAHDFLMIARVFHTHFTTSAMEDSHILILIKKN